MAAAHKGSQFHIQKYVNDYTEELNQYILTSSPSLLAFMDRSLEVNWKSPLKHNNYYEFQDDFLNVLIEDQKELAKYETMLRQYWPKKGPVWDGIAIVNGHNHQKGLLLVEAKAYTNETLSKIKASSPTSLHVIKQSIHVTQKAFGSNSSDDPWLSRYYQLANRLTFLSILNDKLHIPTWLVLCNFVEDEYYKPTTLKKWLQHYQLVFNRLDIQPHVNLMNKIVSIYVPAIHNNSSC